MGFSERHAIRHLKDPVRGVFKVTGFYDHHSGTRITGVITAPGLAATAAEHKTDRRGRWAGNDELPVAVERADPSKFVILWDEVDPVSWQSQETQAAQRLADQLNAGVNGPPGAGFDGAGLPDGAGPGYNYTTTVTIGPDGKPLSAAAAAQISEVVKEALAGISGAFGGGPGTPYGGFDPAQAAQAISAQAGERGTAVVLEARDGVGSPAFPLPPGGQADLLLEVTRADGSVYQTRTVVAFSTPERRAAVATPGSRFTVWIDPGSPSRVAVDPTGLPG